MLISNEIVKITVSSETVKKVCDSRCDCEFSRLVIVVWMHLEGTIVDNLDKYY